jgi:hypothetical protein
MWHVTYNKKKIKKNKINKLKAIYIKQKKRKKTNEKKGKEIRKNDQANHLGQLGVAKIPFGQTSNRASFSSMD